MTRTKVILVGLVTGIVLGLAGLMISSTVKNFARMHKEKVILENKSFIQNNTWLEIKVKLTSKGGEGGCSWNSVSAVKESDTNIFWSEKQFEFPIYLNPNSEYPFFRCVIPREPSVQLAYYDQWNYPWSITYTNIKFTTSQYLRYNNVQCITYIGVDTQNTNCYRMTVHLGHHSKNYHYFYEEGTIISITNYVVTNAYEFFENKF